MSGAILAGGRATRFGGRDKGALVVGGKTIRERQLDALGAVADDVMLVGGVDAGGGRYVPDAFPEGGPMVGVLSALRSARHDWTIVVACDMPFVTTPLFRLLVGMTREADVVVPRTARGYHPLCAVYRRTCVDALERRLRERRLKMSELFDDVRVRVATSEELAALGDPERLLANVNTPSDHAGLDASKSHEI